MATATRTTKSGIAIKVEVVRSVVEDVAYADGWNVALGRTAATTTTITLTKDGKVIGKGERIAPLSTVLIPDLAAAKKGAVGQVGKQFVGAETAALINEAIVEAEAATTKSEEYVALEAAAATAKPQQSAEERARIAAMNAIQRRMDDPNSDL